MDDLYFHFETSPRQGYACAAPNVFEPNAWVLVGLVLSPLAIVLGAQDAQRTEHYLCPWAKLECCNRSFPHIYPISLSANAIQGSCCTIHVVLPVSTTNSSPTAC